MYNSQLHARLAYQHKIEDWLRATLEKKYNLNPDESYLAPRDQPFDAYDFYVQTFGFVECKNDRLCNKTNNVSIEFEKYSMNVGHGCLNDRRLSGISTTQSNYYGIVIDRIINRKNYFEIIMVPTENLRDLIYGRNRETKYCNFNKLYCNTTKCFLIPYSELQQFSIGYSEEFVV